MNVDMMVNHSVKRSISPKQNNFHFHGESFQTVRNGQVGSGANYRLLSESVRNRINKRTSGERPDLPVHSENSKSLMINNLTLRSSK